MAIKKILKKMLHVNGAAIDNVYFEEAENGTVKVIVRVHLTKGQRLRDPYTGKKCPKYDNGDGIRRWRTCDFGEFMVYIEAEAPRIQREDGTVVVARVPWARHNSGFTRVFEDTVVWMVKTMSKSSVAELMRISWNTIGPVISRVKNELEPDISVRWNGLKRIGIDETSYRKGHKYITVIVNHDNNEVVWAAPGHDGETLEKFFRLLSEEQRSSIEYVTGDGASWIKGTCKKYIPQAIFCLDPFHCIQWATDSLDDVRKRSYQKAAAVYKEEHKDEKKRTRGRPKKGETIAKDIYSKEIKGSKYALGKRPENLTENQAARLEMIRISDPELYRAYQLKEKLRLLFQFKDPETVEKELNSWLSWAQRCRIPEFLKLRKKIKKHKEDILTTIRYGLSNARIESTNNKIKLIIRKAYGFRSMQNMLDLILLECSDLPINLPGRGARMKRMRDPVSHSYYYIPA